MADLFGLLPDRVEAELYQLQTRDQAARFNAGTLRYCQARRLGGSALRLVRDGRLGFAATSDPGLVPALVQAALTAAETGRKVDLAWPSACTPSLDTDPELESLSTEGLIALADQWQQLIRRENPDFLVETEATLVEETASIRNTGGGNGSSRRTRLALSCTAELVAGQDILNVYGSVSVGRLADLDLSGLTRNLFGPLTEAPEVVAAGSGYQSVLFTSKAFASIIKDPLLAAFSGRNVFHHTSPLAGKLGEHVFSDRLSVTDDATLPLAPSSGSIDDEGVPTMHFPLIEAGVVRAFAHDLSSAAAAGSASTGHARRIGRTSGARLSSLPQPGFSNVVVQPGDMSFEQLVSCMDHGVIVDQISGTPGFNPGGDFSVTIQLGFLVRAGRIVGRIKNTMLSGNAFAAMANIAAIGRGANWLGGGESGALLVPPMLVDGLKVTER